jgi:CubicO group peptidase (beta-lactamase class C family)
MPSIPEDAYAARGHYGQSVVVIPSKQLVVVRMGQTFNPSAWDTETFLAELLSVLPK